MSVINFFFKSAIKVLSSWYVELEVANSAFYNVGWQRRAVKVIGAVIAHICLR
jgi:hypothetical protein